MADESIYENHLLSDDPSDVDEFSDSHLRVAKAIAKLIQTNDGGKTIGLEGEWGSGKSTVLKLLQDILEEPKGKKPPQEEKKYGFFIFDTWAHESDPLRKTFLRQLLDFLINKNWQTEKRGNLINKFLFKNNFKKKDKYENWNDNFKELIGQKKTIKTENYLEISLFLILLYFLTILSTIGISIFGNSIKDINKLSEIIEFNINNKVTWGIILIILPIIVLIIIGIINIFLKRKINFSFIFNKNDTNTTTTYIHSSPDTTSIEFEDFFTKVISFFINNDNRRLILVLDNLDRISTEDAKSILSTMQTFLQCESKLQKSEKTKNILKRLWIIIPYDRDGLEKLWISNEDSINSDVANSMIDKRFQIIFRVPPPVLSNWEGYFKKQLKKAIPNQTENDYDGTYRIYYLLVYLQENNRIPTPREIKRFINQICALCLQWENKFPIPKIGYFVTLHNRNYKLIRNENNQDSIYKKILKGSIHESTREVQNILGENIIENLAAMWFNVEESLAVQLLLEKPIINAIIHRDKDTLYDLATNHDKCFWAIFNTIPMSDWAKKEPINLLHAIYCIENKNILNIINSDSANKIIPLLFKSLNEIEEWKLDDDQWIEGITSLFRFQLEVVYLSNLFKSITFKDIEILSNTNRKQIIDQHQLKKIIDDISPIIKRLVKIIDGLINHELIEYFNVNPININIDPFHYMEACVVLANNNDNDIFWKIFLPNIKPKEIIEGFISVINLIEFDNRYITIFRILLNNHQNISYDQIVNTILVILNENVSKKDAALLEMVWMVKENENIIIDSSNALLSQPLLIQNIFGNLLRKGDWFGCAWCIFVFLKLFPNLNISQISPTTTSVDSCINFLNNPGGNTNNEAILFSFVDIIAVHNQMNFLFETKKKVNYTNDLIKEVVITLINKNWRPSTPVTQEERKAIWKKIFFPECIINNWRIIQDFIDISLFNVLIAAIVDTLELFQKDFTPENSGLYKSIFINLPINHNENDFIKWLCSNLQMIDKERWQISLYQEDELLDLLSVLIENQTRIGLGKNFSNAYIEYSDLVLKKQTKPSRFFGMWSNFTQSITSKVFEKNLIIGIINNLRINNSYPSDFFELYGNLIMRPELLLENIDIIQNLFLPLVENRNSRGLQWFSELLNLHNNLFNKYESNPEYTVFMCSLRNALTENVEEISYNYLEKIARILHIEKPGKSE